MEETRKKLSEKDLDILRRAVADKGDILLDAGDYHYGEFVIPCRVKMFNIPVEHQVCRVVQIRKEIGQFGSDLFFVRHADGILTVWENQSFHKVKPEYIRKIQTVYNRHDAIEIDDDEPGKSIGYNYPGNEEYITGFIIPSPYPADHVTPMKKVKAGIRQQIERIMNQSNDRSI